MCNYFLLFAEICTVYSVIKTAQLTTSLDLPVYGEQTQVYGKLLGPKYAIQWSSLRNNCRKFTGEGFGLAKCLTPLTCS